ncbi:hypothetical protein ACNFJ7_02130 [Sphingomonas sp. HT-1]|uniref:hypothetical protein n=1 Tax=unclassified Sphingomonas TaxID=196159 RepID=UPI0002E08B8F|nr:MULTISPECIES: hypothetical protein [unclassified Sphingomonas]KTF68668.1 hypothetical protein ATB93_13160 [Sphingomonas sp. WG]
MARATEDGATFSASDIAVIEPIAKAVAPSKPADERTIRQSIGTLAASMPAQSTSEVAGRLKLNAYVSALGGCDAAALAYACRRCLKELDWFPTVRQIEERLKAYVSPEQHAINVARYILRNGKREAAEETCGPVTDEQVRRMSTEIRRMGLRLGHIPQEQLDRITAEERAAEAPEQRAA